MSKARFMMDEVIDLTDPQYLAMIRSASPAINYHTENSAFASSSDRTGPSGVFRSEGLLIQFPRPMGANQIRFGFELGGFSCYNSTDTFFSNNHSTSHQLDIKFVTSPVDVTTHAWNDYLSYSFSRTISFFNFHINPGDNSQNFSTVLSITGSGKAGSSGLRATTNSLSEALVRGIVILCQAPGCRDGDSASLTYDAACSAMRILRGDF